MGHLILTAFIALISSRFNRTLSYRMKKAKPIRTGKALHLLKVCLTALVSDVDTVSLHKDWDTLNIRLADGQIGPRCSFHSDVTLRLRTVD